MPKYYRKEKLSGGTSLALDGINGEKLVGEDTAFVYISEKEYIYKVDSDLSGTLRIPFVVNPTADPTTKSWVLQSRVHNGINSGHGVYDFGDSGGGVGSIVIGSIPDNSSITKSIYEVLTTPTSGGAASIALGVATDDTSGITEASSFSGDNFDVGYHNTPVDGTASAFTTKSTAERNVLLTISTADLTAGLIHVWWEYIISE